MLTHRRACFAVAEGDLAELLDGHFGVDLRRPRRAVADEIPDLLQREVGIDEPLHERVAQRVGAWPRNLDASPQQISRCAGGDRGAVRPAAPAAAARKNT